MRFCKYFVGAMFTVPTQNKTKIVKQTLNNSVTIF